MKYRHLVLTAVLVFFSAFTTSARAVTDEEVGEVIDKMRKWLFTVQNAKTGEWQQNFGKDKTDRNYGGETALVVSALLTSKEPFQRPEMLKALDFLRDAEITGTYAMGLRTNVWSLLPDEFQPLIERDCLILLQTAADHTEGTFDYTLSLPGHPSKSGRIDHSVTQYGFLGIWAAVNRGARVSPDFWKRVEDHFIKYQLPDGGWDYGGNIATGTSSPAMTCAGLTCMFITQQYLHGAEKTQPPNVVTSINRGLAWLDKNYGPAIGDFYYLYGTERVGLASGHKFFNKQDWYREGAARIVSSVGGDGSVGANLRDTAFSLLFLVRGRYPVVVNKIQFPDAAGKFSNSRGSMDGGAAQAQQAADAKNAPDQVLTDDLVRSYGIHWNNRPNDMRAVVNYLSDQFEKELNWQVVPIDSDPNSWLNAPWSWMSTDQELHLSNQQALNLKQYLDHGGLLLFNADGSNAKVLKSAQELAQQLYPQFKFRRLPNEHPLFNVLEQIPNGVTQNVLGLSNGVRELILIAPRDWGSDFNFKTQIGTGPAWRMAINLFALTSDKGLVNNRLVEYFDQRQINVAQTGELIVGRPRYEGNWLPEPAAWVSVGNRIYNTTGINVTTTTGEDDKTRPQLPSEDVAVKGKPGAADAKPAEAKPEEAKAADAKPADAKADAAKPAEGAAAAAGADAATTQPAEPPLDLDKIGDSTLALIHLTGVESVTLSPAQLDAIIQYAKNGGTILIETVGGRGEFSHGIETQLTTKLGAAPVPLDSTSPIISGEGLQGGCDAKRVQFRRYAVEQMAVTPRPRLLAYNVGGHNASIILSHEDLSMGLLGVHQWGILGYEPESAKKLITNIALWAHQQRNEAAPVAPAAPASPAAQAPVQPAAAAAQ